MNENPNINRTLENLWNTVNDPRKGQPEGPPDKPYRKSPLDKPNKATPDVTINAHLNMRKLT